MYYKMDSELMIEIMNARIQQWERKEASEQRHKKTELLKIL